MSTILKTLKKLEEEKSVLDQGLDLKGMVLKEDAVYPKALGNDRHRFFLIVTIVTGLLILGGTAFYYWAAIHKVPAQFRHVATKIPKQQTLLPKKLPKLRTFEGVSMAGIPSSKKKTTVKPEENLAFSRQVVTKPAAESLASKQPTASKPLFKSSPKGAPSSEISSDLEEIESIIQSATTLAKNSPAAPVTFRNGYIPGVKVKGIIFFDKESPSNHIIVTTQNNSNLKLRVGDPVQNAVLKSIHPNRVIFLYQDQPIEMGIGQ